MFRFVLTKIKRAPRSPQIIPMMIAAGIVLNVGDYTKVALNFNSCTALMSFAVPSLINLRVTDYTKTAKEQLKKAFQSTSNLQNVLGLDIS